MPSPKPHRNKQASASSLSLRSRIRAGGACITCMSACHDVVAVADILQSVRIYQFDSKTQSLLQIYETLREQHMVTEIHLSAHDEDDGGRYRLLRLLAFDASKNVLSAMLCHVPSAAIPEHSKKAILEPLFYYSMPNTVSKIIGLPSGKFGFADVLLSTSFGEVAMLQWLDNSAKPSYPIMACDGICRTDKRDYKFWKQLETTAYSHLQFSLLSKGGNSEDSCLPKMTLANNVICTTQIEKMVRTFSRNRSIAKEQVGPNFDQISSSCKDWLDVILLHRLQYI